MTDPEQHEYFQPEDAVRTVQNPHLTGQVIDERGWGFEYQVRLADGLTLQWFKFYEIELDVDDAEENENIISLAEVKAARGRMN